MLIATKYNQMEIIADMEFFWRIEVKRNYYSDYFFIHTNWPK